MKRAWILSGTLTLAACGEAADFEPIDAELEAPALRQARVTVTPAVDLGSSQSLAGEHFIVEQLVVNLSDVRILGEDPSVPAGGFSILAEPTLVYAEGEGDVGIELPFPPEFLEQEGLAVYLRAEPSSELDEAAIMVVGRWVDSVDAAALTGSVDPDGEPVLPGSSGVVDPDGEPVEPDPTEGVVDPDGEPVQPEPETGVVDPDGEPVRPRDGVVDPDGEPVKPDPETGVVDPDGEPVECLEFDCGQRAQALRAGRRVVLREMGAIEVVVTLGRSSRFNLVFGVPVTRWIDDKAPVPEGETSASGPNADSMEPVVLTSSERDTLPHDPEVGSDLTEQRDGEGYYLVDGLPVEDAITRGPGL